VTEFVQLDDLLVRGRFAHLDPIGVVDIGSNSVRLVVYEGPSRAPTPLFNEKVLCGLGRSIASKGRLGGEARDRALKALARFRAIVDVLHVKSLHVIATAAVREAFDGAEFIRDGEKAIGNRITVLSGEQEAQYAAAGIMMGFNHPDGLAGDLGGGSLELIEVKGGELRGATTLPLGGLRLIDMTNGERGRAERTVEQHLRGPSWLGHGRGRPFYAVGGTWRSLARLHMAELGYPLRVAHAYSIKTAEALAFAEKVARAKKLSSFRGIEVISRDRRETLPFGAVVLAGLLRRIQPSEVVTSVFGIREGLLYNLLSPADRERDPLLVFCLDYARLRSRSPEHALELCRWTDALFVAPGPEESEEERRLRQAACMMSDIGWRAHPDYRGEQSLAVIAHAAYSGVDHPGRAFIALSVLYRHTSQVTDILGSRLTGLLTKRMLRRARLVGAAIRAAHMLSIGMAGVIPRTRLTYEGERLVVTLPKSMSALAGERLSRRFGALAGLLERKPEIRFGS
jgi:exopolyphosphatase/guanosine-5'-triphosphate,3'-diphosphate pyrophosphatase